MTELEVLIDKAIEGDSQAYTQLYKMSRRQVYFTCLGLLKNESDAEDMMQETFFTVMIKLVALKDKNSFQAWVNRIAINKCRNFLTKNKSLSYDEDIDEMEEQLPDEDISLPDEYVEDEAKRKIIMDIIMTNLSDFQRQTVIMYYYNEMTTAEIAAEMECPLGTVTYRLSMARKVIEREVLRYEKITSDRLHAVLPVPFLTTLLRTEAEKIHLPDLSAFMDSALNMTASTPETTHSVMSKIVAAVTAVIVGGGATAYYVSENFDNDVVVAEEYAYYELLDEEYQKIKGNGRFNSYSYWNGTEVYFSDMNSPYPYYFRYDSNSNTLEEIISDETETSIEINGEIRECTIRHGFLNYYYNNHIYGIGMIIYDDFEELGSALIKYDLDGNILDYFLLNDVIYNEDEGIYSDMNIYGITDEGHIYLSHSLYKFPDKEYETTLLEADYMRINTNFTGFEQNLNLTPNNDEYYCIKLECYNSKLYVTYAKKEDDSLAEPMVCVYDEKTLEPIENDFFVQNALDIINSVGKYMITENAIYDSQINEILAKVPSELTGEHGLHMFDYAGGQSHYYHNSSGNYYTKVKLPSNVDYSKVTEEDIKKFENESYIEISDFIINYMILDSDAFICIEPEATYFCRISTGEKTKIEFPWSVTDEKSEGIFKNDSAGFLDK